MICDQIIEVWLLFRLYICILHTDSKFVGKFEPDNFSDGEEVTNNKTQEKYFEQKKQGHTVTCNKKPPARINRIYSVYPLTN